MNATHSILVSEYLRQREWLVAEFPELAEDVQALADTLEGECEAPDVIASFIRSAREDEAMCNALTAMIREQQDRRSRMEARAERKKAAAKALLDACGIRKIELPDFTVSIRAVPPSVVIEDADAIPLDLCKITPVPDKTAIKERLQAGETVAGARLSNGSESIAIRVR